MKVLGSITIAKLIFDDLEELVLPADILLDPANGNVEAPHDPRFQIAKEMQGFVLRVGDVSTLFKLPNSLIESTQSTSLSLTCSVQYA